MLRRLIRPQVMQEASQVIRLSTTTRLSLIIAPRREFHVTKIKSMPCIGETDAERWERMDNEKDKVLQDNKNLEKKLCEVRSSYVDLIMRFGHLLKDGDKATSDRILAEHKKHRLEEHKLSITTIEEKLKKIARDLSKLDSKKMEFLTELAALAEQRDELTNALNTLKSVDTNTPAFLNTDSVQEERAISKKLK